MENAVRRPKEIQYEVLTDYSQVHSIREEWDALAERSSCNRAFGCARWFLGTPEIRPAMTPIVFIARRKGAIEGILPIAFDPETGKGRFPHNWMDYPDIIAEDDDLEVMAGLLRLAMSGVGHYESLLLECIRRDSNCLRAAQVLAPDGEAGRLFQHVRSWMYSYVDLNGGYEEYLSRTSRRFRHNLCGFWNRAHRSGIVGRELTPNDIAPDELPEVFLSLHMSRFGENTPLKSTKAWLQQLFPYLFADGRMRVFSLTIEDRIVAIHITMVGRNTLFGWNAGFLPEIQSCSPGRLLLDVAIRCACSEGLEEYDFGWRGDYDYKDHWKPSSRELVDIECATRPAASD